MEAEFYESKKIIFDFNSIFLGRNCDGSKFKFIKKDFGCIFQLGVEILAELQRNLQSRPELIYLKLNRKFLIQQITIQF